MYVSYEMILFKTKGRRNGVLFHAIQETKTILHAFGYGEKELAELARREGIR
ncbi:MAG: hypothetical protein LBQ96_00595 [Fusobacteriaceae bacterium]|jgi:hypothetical protein|nr:hypothetical protein [Fusobacteriaceae bacterium]